MSSFARSRVTAVLGPTNTGKTYLAIERMLGYRSGMIGFPLRLLARENYDRIAKAKGARHVALVTGEEKIVPPHARYFFCTVESMPIDRPVEFLAVDEIQLCADPERGHVFTDRLLHARGGEETMFLGADTIRPVLQRLVRKAEYVSRPRFSTLSYSGHKKITRLPPRSAVVAFSAANVYAIAELMRRQRGGTAVVLGALSPRTRNAQVAMFEAGEVDYLVATDAIGMGLNLNLDHVAFCKLSKFDGRGPRRLTPAEVGQIAGRAGRHMSDGSFGTTAELGGMEQELIDAVESHSFDALRSVFWRNRELEFRTPQTLLKSLERRPPAPELIRARGAEDYEALSVLSRDPEVERLAAAPAPVRLLWEVCQIPDFQKTLTDQHARLLGRIYRYLMSDRELLPEDWVAQQIARIDRVEGDIDALVARIAQIRTWTYIAHRGDWLADAGHWQERSRAIEDRLSDSLHDRLTQRFVDRRAASLVRRLQGGEQLLGAVRRNGEVVVEGELVGRLEGFRFLPDSGGGEDMRAVLTAARRALASEIPARVKALEADEDKAFALDESGNLSWHGTAIARLAAGSTHLAPRIVPLASEFLDGAQRERIRKRLAAWLEGHLRARLRPLTRLADAELAGAAKGLAYQLTEALGSLPRAVLAKQLGALSKADRKALSALGVRLGRASVYLPALLKPRATRLRALLWSLHEGCAPPALPKGASVAGEQNGAAPDAAFHHAVGYRRFARKGEAVTIRVDALERLANEAAKLAKQGAFAATADLKRAAGCGEAGLALLLGGLGYRVRPGPEGLSFEARGPKGRKGRRPDGTRERSKRARKRPHKAAADSPFAPLRNLKISQ